MAKKTNQRELTPQKKSVAAVPPKRLVGDLRRLIEQSRQELARAVNAGLVTLYWHIGHRIRQDILGEQRATYGEQIVNALSTQLTAEYGRGFTRTNLFYMVQFAEVFPDERIVHALRGQLSWTHVRELIAIDDPLKREFYAEMCRAERWSTRTLQDQIKRMVYPTRRRLVEAGLAIVIALTPAVAGQAEIETLPFRTSAQQEVAPVEEIVDGQWIVIGTSEKNGGRVIRDGDNLHKGQPVYRFSAEDDTVNRIEFSEVFGSAENLKGLSEKEIADFLAIKDAYVRADVGRYGDTATYEWSTRFPEKLDADSQAIIAQWHGRPDRTLVDDGRELRYLPIAEFVKLTETYEFRKDGWGYDKTTGKRSHFRVDGAAGGPIAALKIGFDHIYLVVRSDASRRSSNEVKLKPKPMHEIGHRMREGLKEASLVWKLPLSEVPMNKWIDFRVRIKYSEYSTLADEVLSPGSVDVWMNGKPVAAWQGNIGKNDILGPYFKFGIYKPGKTGFKVEHAAYCRTIQRTRKSPVD
jgi:hypothetical protein